MGRHRVVGKVAESIMRRLVEGQWLEPGTFPSVRELTALCGVSAKTMMAALRELAAAGLLLVEQRKRIEVAPGAREKARDLLQGPAEAGETVHRMAILYPEWYMPPSRNAFYAAMLRAIGDEAAKRGIRTEVVPWTVQNQMAVADSLVRRGFDRALIVSFNTMFAAAVLMFCERGFPFIIFNHRPQGIPVPSVVFDAHAAAARMADRLVNLGHRNLCLVVHPHDYSSEVETDLPENRGKASGWLECLQERGVLDSCTIPIYLPWEPVLGLFSRMFRAMMNGPDRPTAILFGHSPWARVFMEDPELSRFCVPQELSVATFEPGVGIRLPAGCPPLTTIDVNYTRTAQCIMETIEKLASGGTNVPTIRVPLDTQVTESIGPAPQGAGGVASVTLAGTGE